MKYKLSQQFNIFCNIKSVTYLFLVKLTNEPTLFCGSNNYVYYYSAHHMLQ